MRKVLVPVAALAVAAIVAGFAIADDGKGNRREFTFAVGLWGDLPYSSEQANPGVPNLIADMNNAGLVFSVHNGDLKAGRANATPPSVTCDDQLYADAKSMFDSLKEPAIFTPGDNDWTDCDRVENGPFNSLERLDYERHVFFSTDRSLGQKTLQQEVQKTPLCKGFKSGTAATTTEYTNVPCVENRRWTYKNVTFATLNVQGTCNNRCSSGTGDPAGDDVEWAARNAADLQWLKDTFATAKAHGSAGVMIIWQADVGFDESGYQGAPKRRSTTLVETDGAPDGVRELVWELRSQTIAFGKPVVLVHGDSHYFMVDKPLKDVDGKRIENFTRVEAFGDNAANGLNDVHWVKALVDPESRDVFAFQAQTVPGNVVAHNNPPFSP